MAERAENPGVDNRAVGFTAIAVLVFLAAVLGFFALAFSGTINRPFPIMQYFPQPQVTQNEAVQRLHLEDAQRMRIAGQNNGALPIIEAMRQVAARGAKAYDPVTEAPP